MYANNGDVEDCSKPPMSTKALNPALYWEWLSGGGPARQGVGLLIQCPQGLGGSNPSLRALFSNNIQRIDIQHKHPDFDETAS